jgi:CRP/FNR family transcriptional regulator, cyclic AMP receptor protein
MRREQDMKAIQLFAGFDNAEIDAFVAAADRRSVPADHVFFAMGKLNSSLFIIRSGSVKVDRLGTSENIPLATLKAGQTFGEMSCMDGSRTTGTVTAQEPTEVFEISQAALDKLLAGNPALGVKLWRNIALALKQRLTSANEVIDQYVDINQVLLQDQSLRDYYGRL